MTRYDPATVLAGLKDFQRTTVDHVIDRFFGAEPTRRFLVADETGLGKSVVARGVIAKTLERLQDDDTVDRIDVVYVCSNQDVAAQNIRRLQVTADETVTLASRLTLLAKDAHKLTAARPVAGKPLNLVAFTPGTSFDQGWRTGTAEERALLFLLLEQASDWDGWRRRAALRALQGGVGSSERFAEICTRLETSLNGTLNETIADNFVAAAGEEGLLKSFGALLDEIGHRSAVPADFQESTRKLVGDLRAVLAKSGVDVLEPDLVILDEFQRFRELLDPASGPAADLAQHLFNYGAGRVLLLSATPYKPFTFAEEATNGEDHYKDFRQVLRFLDSDESWDANVTQAFQVYRDALVRGGPTDEIRELLRVLLLRVMSRTERPGLGTGGMLREHINVADEIEPEDLRSYVALRRIATTVGAPMTIEYWKSAPYFLNFLDGYQIGAKVREALKDTRVHQLQPMLASAQLLDADAIAHHRQVDFGNGRLRRLATDTIDRNWWELLWLPPSLLYYRLGAPFADAARQGITKRLLFSSWNATPTAVAGLLSYEAERRIGSVESGDQQRRRARLDYRVDAGRPAAMSTLALFWPHPGLASLCDPLVLARQRPDETASLETLDHEVRDLLRRRAPAEFQDPRQVGEVHAWQAVFRWPGADLDGAVNDRVASAVGGSQDEDTTASGFTRHVEHALGVMSAEVHPVARDREQVIQDLAAIGLHGPGNIAWRALSRLVHADSKVTPVGHWAAAATLADGLRTLFNRVESACLLDRFLPDTVYWRVVLRYCAVGGLQAVLDEHLHILRSATSDVPLDDEGLMCLAVDAQAAISARPATYDAFDPHRPDQPIKLPGRFALRYGGRGDDQTQTDRKRVVRQAFNSPFWPFVVTTTSAGQEGIDFHQWCSAVVHWNTPANPVDFEQREGRVHRFGGHAVRRNVAAKHRADALRSAESDVWKAAYDAARATSGELGDFAPYWVFEGDAMIERHVFPYPLSRDGAKLTRLKTDLAHYRLAFGQPRQEDLLTILRRSQDGAARTPPQALDLRPR